MRRIKQTFMEILIILALNLINGIFSMSEISVVSSRKFKLDEMSRKGNKGAKKALELAESPSKFLSTVQIGITLIGILLGIYSGENLTKDLEGVINTVSVLQPYAHNMAVVGVLIVITFTSILLGELFPKRIGLTFPESIASVIAVPMDILSKVTAPFVWLLTKTNDLLLRLCGINAHSDGIITEEEIKSMISESTESGEIQEIEQDIVERVFAMGDLKVEALMTHRSDLVWLDVADSVDEIIAKIGQELHGAYPVCDEELDNIQGIVLLKDLFLQLHTADFDLKSFIKTPIYSPDTSSAYKLLDDFRKKRLHYSIVVDEYGSVQGMITIDDIVDALVGDISSENQEEYGITENGPGSWIADGQFPIHEFLNYFDLDDADFDDADFSTLGGFAISHLNAIPKTGDKFAWMDFNFEILEMDKRRIERIGIHKRDAAKAS